MDEDGARLHLLADDNETGQQDQSSPSHVGTPDDTADSIDQYPQVQRLLFTSHSLSAWNSRAFEFGAFLFLAASYPTTLLPASVYALTRAGAAAVLAPWIGGQVDHGDRLRVIRLSIVGQRVAVAVSCVLLFLMQLSHQPFTQSWLAIGIFMVLCILAAVEKTCAILNTIAVERDWVVVIAGDDSTRLAVLNSQMRRIDLFCKLVAPLAVSVIDAASTKAAIVATGATTACSVAIEYLAIARVYRSVPTLATREQRATTEQDPRSSTLLMQCHHSFTATVEYVKHPAFLPSFALALLYLTVLSFSGQMITYLVALGFQSWSIGLLRGAAAVVELSATWVAPLLIKHIGPVRAGIWFLNVEVCCVAIAAAMLWPSDPALSYTIGAVAAVVFSRVGLWGFDLSAQIIVQEVSRDDRGIPRRPADEQSNQEVQEEFRGTFSSREFAAQNTFEMLAFASTIVFSKPTEFRYPALMSAGAVGLAAVLYAAFVRLRRGHLLHLSHCLDGGQKQSGNRA